jgi:uncharacterized protein
MKCPNDDTTLAMSDRQGIEIDYCPRCRGVWLDRGELDRIVERERESIDADEDDFMREMTGNQGKPDKGHGFDPKTAERIYSDYKSQRKQKKRKSFLDELFD